MNNLQTLFTDCIMQPLFYIFLGVFAIFLTSRQQDDQTIERGQAWDVITTILVCFADGKVVCRRYKDHFSRIGDFTWSLSDSEELVGVISVDDVVDFGGL